MPIRILHRAALIDHAESLGRKVARLAATLSIARWRLVLADPFQQVALSGPIRRQTTRLLKLEGRFTNALEAMTEAGYGSVAITIARNTATRCGAIERAAYHETMRGAGHVRPQPYTHEDSPCPAADRPDTTPIVGDTGTIPPPRNPSTTPVPCAARRDEAGHRRSITNATK